MILKNTWQHIRRSPYQAFAAISIMLLTFLVSGLFVLLSIGSSIVLSHFEQKPQVTVFFTDNKKEAEIKELSEKLKKDEHVASVKFISKDDALQLYKAQFQKDPLLLEMVSADILPASLEISAEKIEYLKDIAASVKGEKDVEEVVYQQEVVDLLVAWTKSIRTIGIVAIVFLGVVSLFTVVTVVSMKIALKKKEVEILQLVGSTSWYIRGPFLIEGGFYGLIGSFFGWLANIGLIAYATPFLQSLFSGIPLFPIPLWFYGAFFAGMLGVGVILGSFASFLALLRYL